MEFHVRIDNHLAALHGHGDALLEAVRTMIEQVDPSAVLDIDASGCLLRIAAAIDVAQLEHLLDRAGYPTTPAQVRQLPSICCGGCSG